jgi:hypothetical protein
MGLTDPGVDLLDPSGPFDAAAPGLGMGGGGLQFVAGIAASLGSIAAVARSQQARAERLAQVLRWAPLAPIQANPQTQTAVAGTLVLANAEVWGPKTGFFWAVQRFNVVGLTAGSTTTSTATGTITAGAGSAALTSGVSATGFTLSFSAAPSTAGTAVLSNVTGGPYTYNIPSGQTSPYTVSFPGPITATGAATLTIAGLGTGAGTIILYGTLTTAGDSVSIYKGQSGASGTVPQNVVNENQVTATSQFDPSRTDLILQPGDFLTVAGTGLTSTSVTASGDVIIGTLDVLPDFLI